MINFKNVNVNPRNKKTGDCSIRALVSAIGVSWDEALDLLVASAHLTKYEPADRRTMEKVLEEYGFVKMKQPRKSDNTKYVVYHLDEVLSGEYIAVVNVPSHYTVIDSGTCIDSWDCRFKSVGNYYIKRR